MTVSIQDHPRRAEIENAIREGAKTDVLRQQFGITYGDVAELRRLAKRKPVAKRADVPKRKERPCTVCHHPMRESIDRHLVPQSMSVPAISKKYDLDEEALRRHKANPEHLTEEMKRQIVLDNRVQQQEVVAAELNEERVEIDSGLRRIIREIEGILDRAKGRDDDILALGSLKEMRQALMDLAKLQGSLKNELTVNVSLNEAPQWLDRARS